MTAGVSVPGFRLALPCMHAANSTATSISQPVHTPQRAQCMVQNITRKKERERTFRYVREKLRKALDLYRTPSEREPRTKHGHDLTRDRMCIKQVSCTRICAKSKYTQEAKRPTRMQHTNTNHSQRKYTRRVLMSGGL